ncbi:hypothetical protein FQN57_006524 [Myotisia sp. PD_48]|nr:hypothetical protein FQN57_006524 [Myotisia sp. PD_48]
MSTPDKMQFCIPFLMKLVKAHQAKHQDDPDAPPFFVGLNGIQGSGKTTLVSTLQSTLSSPPYNLRTIAFSIDDIYLTHSDQQRLAAAHSSNPLLQHRGQPSTHDIALGLKVFHSLRRNLPTKIPSYDKSAFNGQGDRAPDSTWETVNDVGSSLDRVKIVIFEGWCVGFRPRPDAEIRSVWEATRKNMEQGNYHGQLGCVELDNVITINHALKEYDAITDQLDAFIHLDADSFHYAYDWREQQEAALRASKGTGMTPKQVIKFVDGYFPSYELFIPTLSKGVFKHSKDTYDGPWEEKQLRIVINKDRKPVLFTSEVRNEYTTAVA